MIERGVDNPCSSLDLQAFMDMTVGEDSLPGPEKSDLIIGILPAEAKPSAEKVVASGNPDGGVPRVASGGARPDPFRQLLGNGLVRIEVENPVGVKLRNCKGFVDVEIRIVRPRKHIISISRGKSEGRPEGAKRPTAGDEPREFTSRGEGGRVPPFFEKLRANILTRGNFRTSSAVWSAEAQSTTTTWSAQ